MKRFLVVLSLLVALVSSTASAQGHCSRCISAAPYPGEMCDIYNGYPSGGVYCVDQISGGTFYCNLFFPCWQGSPECEAAPRLTDEQRDMLSQMLSDGKKEEVFAYLEALKQTVTLDQYVDKVNGEHDLRFTSPFKR